MIDGLMQHDTELDPRICYTDTHGFTEVVMAYPFDHHLEKPETLLNAYALLNRIRLCASDAVLAEAERIVHFIAEQYFSPNPSVQELRTLIRSSHLAKPAVAN